MECGWNICKGGTYGGVGRALAPPLFLLQGIAPPYFYTMLMKQAVTEQALRKLGNA